MLNKSDLKLMYGYLHFYKRSMDETKWLEGSSTLQHLLSELFISIKDGESPQEAMKQFRRTIQHSFSSTDDFSILLAHKLERPITLLNKPSRHIQNQSNRALIELLILSKFSQILQIVNNQDVINPGRDALGQDAVLQLANNTVKYVPAKIGCNRLFKPAFYLAGGISTAFIVDTIFFNRPTTLQLFFMPLRYAMSSAKDDTNNPYFNVLVLFAFLLLVSALIPISLISYSLNNSIELSKREIQDILEIVNNINANTDSHNNEPLRQELQAILDKDAELIDEIKGTLSKYDL